MVKNIHRAITMHIKGSVHINMSGSPDNFTYIYANIHPDNATKLIKFETLTSEKEA
jgi:predicted metal-binding protein